MSELYSRILNLCNEKGISIYRMCADIGIRPSAMCDIKHGRKKCFYPEIARKICEYFSVSCVELFGDGTSGNRITEKEKNADLLADYDIDLTMNYLNLIRNSRETRLLINAARGANSDQIAVVLCLLEYFKNAKSRCEEKQGGN